MTVAFFYLEKVAWYTIIFSGTNFYQEINKFPNIWYLICIFVKICVGDKGFIAIFSPENDITKNGLMGSESTFKVTNFGTLTFDPCLLGAEISYFLLSLGQ